MMTLAFATMGVAGLLALVTVYTYHTRENEARNPWKKYLCLAILAAALAIIFAAIDVGRKTDEARDWLREEFIPGLQEARLLVERTADGRPTAAYVDLVDRDGRAYRFRLQALSRQNFFLGQVKEGGRE
jgi:hypothetical protein